MCDKHTNRASIEEARFEIRWLKLSQDITEKMNTFFSKRNQPIVFTQTTRITGNPKTYYGIVVRFKQNCDNSAALDWLYKELQKHPKIYFRITSYDDDRFLVRKDFPYAARLKDRSKKKKVPSKTTVHEST